MKISHPEKTDINRVNTLIFDWGGVITPISPAKAMNEFRKLGHPRIEDYFEPDLKNDLLVKLEIGEITPDQAWELLKKDFPGELETSRLEQAYCSLLLNTPPVRIQLLRKLSAHFKLYLLSNTNAVHTLYYSQLLLQEFGQDFSSLFRQTFYSHELGMRKPGKEIFRKVLDEIAIPAENILFLDDTKTNLETARSLGIHVLWMTEAHPVESIFADWL
ncbi:MAG: HAD family phosphatase [Bacteroidales bacterium]|nr:HAD family phosphatase [Bacteroidales bacterium]